MGITLGLRGFYMKATIASILAAEGGWIVAQVTTASHATSGDILNYILAIGAGLGILGTVWRAMKSLDKATNALQDMKPTLQVMTADLAQARGLEARMTATEATVAQLAATFTITDKPGVSNIVDYLRDWRHDDANLAARLAGMMDLLITGLDQWKTGIERITELGEGIHHYIETQPPKGTE